MGRWRCAMIGLVMTALAGCRTAAPLTPTKATFYKIESFSGSSLSADAHIYAARRQGIGEVYATVPSFGPGAELILRRDPRQDAPVVAYLDYQPSTDGGWEIAFEANEPGLREEITRVSHDDYGLVVESVRLGWVRAVYGYTSTGGVRFGWIRLVPGRVEFSTYDEHIRTHDTYLDDPGRVELFDAPDGRRIRFPLVSESGEELSYKLEVLDIEGDWIEVSLEVPSTNPCGGDPEAKVQRSTTAWVRRHNSQARYQIGYGTAGC
jgi:hypothetical protein